MQELRGAEVYVGLSGGVDSALTAHLLLQKGARVSGVFIKGWYPPNLSCTWAEDRRDAMRVAAHARIPFITLDASAAYKRGVIDYLLAEYKAGRTPNPDIMCNREVKFGSFYRFAREAGARYVATGHYARREASALRSPLRRGADTAKDQSYFLWAVPRETLAHTIFPLGELRKPDVRALAEHFSIPVAKKPDSQGICFLGSIAVDDFLREEFGSEPGVAYDEAGSRIGMHEGALLYTLGERVALADAALPGPWYAIAKDMAANTLTVSRSRTLHRAPTLGIPFEKANWLAPQSLGESASPPTPLDDKRSEPLTAQMHYHGPHVPGVVEKNIFYPSGDTALEFPTPGQSIVFYRGEECLGGGILS